MELNKESTLHSLHRVRARPRDELKKVHKVKTVSTSLCVERGIWKDWKSGELIAGVDLQVHEFVTLQCTKVPYSIPSTIYMAAGYKSSLALV